MLGSSTYRQPPDVCEKANWTSGVMSIIHASWISYLTIGFALSDPGSLWRAALDDPMPPAVQYAVRIFFAYHPQDFAVVTLLALKSAKASARTEGWVYIFHHSLVVPVWGGVFLASRSGPFALLDMICEVTSIFVNIRALLIKGGQGSGTPFMLNGVVLLAAWYPTRFALYCFGGSYLVWTHAPSLVGGGVPGALTVVSWAAGGLLQLQWTWKLTMGVVKMVTGGGAPRKTKQRRE